jgi:TPR repeat protein
MTLFLFSQTGYAQSMDQALMAIDKEDYQQGYQLLLPLAKSNDAEAQYLLGRLLVDELVDSVKPEQGVHWLKKAIQNKHYEAAQVLSKMYLSGMVVPLDTEKGSYYLKLAEEYRPKDEPEEECD